MYKYVHVKDNAYMHFTYIYIFIRKYTDTYICINIYILSEYERIMKAYIDTKCPVDNK